MIRDPVPLPPPPKVCRHCKGIGVVCRWRQDAYGPPAFHTQVCICRFAWATDAG